MKKVKVIGITGGIGSGKSLISRIIASRVIPVYNSDEAAKSLYDRYPDLLEEVLDRFGRELLDGSGNLDRSALANIVFSDEQALKDLNSMVHPRVREDFNSWQKENNHAGVVVKEAAILIESGAYKDCDLVWLVTAPEELREQRVMQRDMISRELVRQRMSKQWTDEKKLSYSDAVIINDNKKLIVPQVMDLLENLNSGSLD